MLILIRNKFSDARQESFNRDILIHQFCIPLSSTWLTDMWQRLDRQLIMQIFTSDSACRSSSDLPFWILQERNKRVRKVFSHNSLTKGFCDL